MRPPCFSRGPSSLCPVGCWGNGSPEKPLADKLLYERAYARHVTTHDQRLDRVWAFVRIDDLHVGEVARYVVLQQDSVAAHDVPGVGADLLGLARVVHLG